MPITVPQPYPINTAFQVKPSIKDSELLPCWHGENGGGAISAFPHFDDNGNPHKPALPE